MIENSKIKMKGMICLIYPQKFADSNRHDIISIQNKTRKLSSVGESSGLISRVSPGFESQSFYS